MDLNKLLARMAVEVVEAETTEETIETISQFARVAVSADGAGILLVGDGGTIETPTATSVDIEKAHRLQAEFGEGPCLSALERDGEAIYVVTNTLHDERWPRWGKAAAALGFLSVVSASLNTSNRRLGSLNAYARTADAFDDADAEALDLLSNHATAALAGARTEEGLRKALSNRGLIGQAQGLLMAAYEIDSDTAFGYMRRLSQDQNRKLAGVAKAIVENPPGSTGNAS